jgi:hypothetical protein
MRVIILVLALGAALVSSADAQTNGGYVVTPQRGFMPNPTPGYPPNYPYVFGSHPSPYVFNQPGSANINSPSLRQQYYMYSNQPRR